MTDGLDPKDEELRRRLSGALEVIEVDVDAHWERFLDDLRAERRRSGTTRVAAAAAVLALALTAGRPLVAAGGGALVRLVSGVAASTVDWIAESVEDLIPGLGPGDLHDPIDEDNDYWVAIRSVHEQLNDAVGYDRWEPDELDGAAKRLDDLAGADAEFEDEVRSAAELIRTAQEDDDREPAVAAHRLIEDIERGLRRR